MSKVALRVYNRDIEALIDQGHLEEAIAHCQHVLKTYPKYLESYRLLGKAYLEARRFADAADIFQRVLLAVPDDFVSHLGMSIVYDEQKDLDKAIWHMERAYELSPSNTGVQNELRRLYGRRDGLEPPKIRLTRGALAQMYTKGGQYQQAIVEIKSVLAEDSTRSDLKILLARAYFRAGMKVEATEICTELLRQYPHSLDANRILVDILPGTSLAGSVEQYKKRVQALDPYAGLVTGSLFEVDSVPDAAVAVDRLDYDGTAQASGWQAPDVQAPAMPEIQPSTENLPDWMKQAGWGASTGEFKEGPVSFDEPEPPSAAAEELATAEIPDWLKAMAPPGSSAAQPSAAPARDEQPAAEDLDWLAGLGGPLGDAGQPPADLAAAPADSTPDWMQDLGQAATGAAGLAAGSAAAEEGFDWLNNLSAPQDAKPAETQPARQSDVPDWLSGLGEAQPETPAAEPTPDWLSGLGTETAPKAEETAPDWLSGLGEAQPAAAAAEAAPDWLSELGTEKSGPQAAEVVPDWLGDLPTTKDETPAKTEPVADWLKDLTPASEEPPLSALISGPGTSAAEQDEALKWLESLAEKQGAKAEELLTKPSERIETAPGWVDRVETAPAQPAPAAPEPYIPEKPIEVEAEPVSGELSPVSKAPGTGPLEQAEAMKWLESLAEKQGAKAEELITPPAERAATAPAWVSEVQNPPTELSALISGPGTSESEQDDAMKWLESLAMKQGAKAEELITKPEERTESLPDWVSQVGVEPSTPVTPPAPTPVPVRPVAPEEGAAPEELSALISGPGTSEAEQDDAMKWLESLAMKQGAKAEELITKPEERTEALPDWVSQVGVEPSVPVTPPAPTPAPARPVVPEEGAAPEELSALISGPGTSEAEQDDAMKWLESLAMKQGAKAEELITKPEERTEALPDWVSQVGVEPSAPVTPPAATPTPARSVAPEEGAAPEELSALISGPGTSESEQDDAMKWLEMLAAKQGAKAEELLTKPEERTESLPDWVSQVGVEPSTPVTPPAPTPVPVRPVAPEEGAAPEELSALISGPGTSEAEQDDAMKWLEMLAAKQGAKAEELITKPEERTEALPDWVSQVGVEPSVPVTPPAPTPAPARPVVPEEGAAPEELSALISGPGTSEAEQDDAMKWLESLAMKQGAKAEELITKPEERTEALPDWVSQVGAEPPAAVPAEPVAEAPLEALPWEIPAQPVPPESMAEAEAPSAADDWLASLGQPEEKPVAGLMPWEQEAPAEPAVEPAVEPMPWEQLAAETPTEPLPWEQSVAEAPIEPVSFEAPAAETPAESFSWEQPETEKPVAPLPWEQPADETPAETVAFEAPVAETPSESFAWEQPATETPAESIPWEQPVAETPAAEAPVAEEPASEVSDWLKTLEEQPSAAPAETAAEAEELPDWLKDMSADEQAPAAPAPVSSWMPAEPVAPPPAPVVQPPVSQPPVPQTAKPAPAVVEPPAKPVPPKPLRLRPTAGLQDKEAFYINRAREALDRGSLEESMGNYTRLIKKGKLLEEVIDDLSEIVYRHPVDVVVWQTLGDAYMRSNRLQEALDSYTKAEELLRR